MKGLQRVCLFIILSALIFAAVPEAACSTTTQTGLTGNQSISISDAASYDIDITNHHAYAIAGDTFTHRKLLTVNPSSEPLTDYQILKKITYDSAMQADFDDLRFVQDGTVLSHWPEDRVNSSYYDVWINVSSISTTTGAEIWMYYGNPSLSSASSIGDTFLFGDDFDSDLIDGFTSVSEASLWGGDATNNWLGRPCLENHTNTSTWVATYVHGAHRTNLGDEVLHIRFSTDEGVTWTAEDTYTDGNPVVGFPITGHDTYAVGEALLIVAPNDDLVVMSIETKDFTIGAADMNGVYQFRSTDGGATWADEGRAFTKTCLQISDYVNVGTDIYIPIEYDPSGDYTSPASSILYKSDNNGVSWSSVSNITEMTDCPPCSAWPETGIEYCGNNTFLTVIRAASTYDKTLQRISTDMGATWGTLDDITSQVGVVRGRGQLIRMYDEPDRIYLTTRNQSPTPEGAAISYTDDNGATWCTRFVLDTAGVLSMDYMDILKRANGTYYTIYGGGDSVDSDIRESIFISNLVPDMSKWTVTGTVEATNSELALNGNDAITSLQTFDFDVIVTAKVIADEQDSSFVGFYASNDDRMQLQNSDYVALDNFNHVSGVFIKVGIQNVTQNDLWDDFRTYHQYTMKRINSSLVEFGQDSNVDSHTDAAYISTLSMGVNMYVWNSSQESTLTSDWIFVRKYTATEPTWSADGAEQTSSLTNITASVTGDSNTQEYTTTQLRSFTLTPTGTTNHVNVTTDSTDYNITITTADVSDTTDPTYSGATHSTTEIGTSCTFGIQYNDNSALHTNGQYIFSTNNSGAWVNESEVNFTATPQTIETIKTLNSTSGVTVGYRWYASDNAGNTADTPIYTLETTETQVVTYVNVAALVTGTALTVTTDMTGATFTSVGDSVWNYEKGIDLFTGVGGLIVLAIILIVVSTVVLGMRGEMQIEKLIGISMGILVLVVIFPMIVMTGAQIEEVSDAGDGSTATLTITDVPSAGQTLEINSETFTMTDGTPGPYLVDIGLSSDTEHVASQIVDSINTYSSVVSAT